MDCQFAFFPVNAILIIFTVKLRFCLSRDRMLMVFEQHLPRTFSCCDYFAVLWSCYYFTFLVGRQILR